MIIQLQHKFYCPHCQALQPMAAVMIDDNRSHLLCLECGTNYVNHQKLDDFDYIPAPVGMFEECTLEAQCDLLLKPGFYSG